MCAYSRSTRPQCKEQTYRISNDFTLAPDRILQEKHTFPRPLTPDNKTAVLSNPSSSGPELCSPELHVGFKFSDQESPLVTDLQILWLHRCKTGTVEPTNFLLIMLSGTLTSSWPQDTLVKLTEQFTNFLCNKLYGPSKHYHQKNHKTISDKATLSVYPCKTCTFHHCS